MVKLESNDGQGAWLLRYEYGQRYCFERFYSEDTALAHARLLPAEYTNVHIELDQEGY